MNQRFDLHDALAAKRDSFDGLAGEVGFYASTASVEGADRRPLLLVHSVNAAASAYEVKPLFDHYAARRPVYALDLPGFGVSGRPAIRYEPRVMIDAIHRLTEKISATHGGRAIDAIALSLSAEFLARAAVERPDAFATVGLISPTGFAGNSDKRGKPESNRGIPWLYNTVTASSRIAQKLFDGLTSRPSIRYFLRKTWGSKDIDQGAFDYAYATAHQPGARHAPFSFLSGYLFSDDINDVYDQLTRPVWMAHGNRGDFTDYRRKRHYIDQPLWEIHGYETGALPHFEILTSLTRDYDAFLSRQGKPATRPSTSVDEFSS